MKKTKKFLYADLIEHPAFKAWLYIQPNVTVPNHIEVIKQKKSSSVYRITRVGPNNSNVIAKHSNYEFAMIELAIYMEILPSLSVPTPKLYGHLKEHDGKFWWLFLEDIGNQHYSPLLASHRNLAAQWLANMNKSIDKSNINLNLPNQGPEFYQRYLQSVLEMVPELEIFCSLEAYQQEMVRDIISMCEFLEEHWNQIDRFCNQFPRTLVHGDCQVKNAHVLSTHSGLVFIPLDWASAGWGLPATDLGQLSLPYKSLPPTIPDYATYLTIVKEKWPDFTLETIKQLADLGKIFWSLKILSISLPELDDKDTYLEGLLYNFSVYSSILANAIQSATWAT